MNFRDYYWNQVPSYGGPPTQRGNFRGRRSHWHQNPFQQRGSFLLLQNLALIYLFVLFYYFFVERTLLYNKLLLVLAILSCYASKIQYDIFLRIRTFSGRGMAPAQNQNRGRQSGPSPFAPTSIPSAPFPSTSTPPNQPPVNSSNPYAEFGCYSTPSLGKFIDRRYQGN